MSSVSTSSKFKPVGIVGKPQFASGVRSKDGTGDFSNSAVVFQWKVIAFSGKVVSLPSQPYDCK